RRRRSGRGGRGCDHSYSAPVVAEMTTAEPFGVPAAAPRRSVLEERIARPLPGGAPPGAPVTACERQSTVFVVPVGTRLVVPICTRRPCTHQPSRARRPV